MPARKLRQKERKKRRRCLGEGGGRTRSEVGDERAVETEDGARSDTNLERKRQPADVDGTKELQEHVEYVVEPIPKDALGSGGEEDAFRGVLARFGVMATPDTPEEEEEETGTVEEEEEQKKEIMGESEDSEEEGEENAREPDRGLSHLPKKKRKEMQQSLVAKLKQISKHPEVVEVWDATAPDPSFLVEIKSIPNTVPVPQHWANKRRYLQGKRGQEKPPFELPDFIAATGIQKIRESYAEKEDDKKMKQKQRERITGKVSKIDIDYQVLHDAFFKHQTKPKLTRFGDIYYEGKEFESSAKVAGGQGFRPGVLSHALRSALGMPPPPPHGPYTPPPWLLAQQRYGPPPSYPSLKIPGVNAPLPPGAQYGFHVGGWGMPPVDHNGVPLYGDVFGPPVESVEGTQSKEEQLLDRDTRWGEIKPYESEEEDEEESEEEEEEEEMEEEHLPPPPPLMRGPAEDGRLDLRKEEAAGSGPPPPPPPLYHVLESRKATIDRGTLLGTDHTYVLPPAAGAGAPGNVDTSVQPEESGKGGFDRQRLVAKHPQRAEQEPSRRT